MRRMQGTQHTQIYIRLTSASSICIALIYDKQCMHVFYDTANNKHIIIIWSVFLYTSIWIYMSPDHQPNASTIINNNGCSRSFFSLLMFVFCIAFSLVTVHSHFLILCLFCWSIFKFIAKQILSSPSTVYTEM